MWRLSKKSQENQKPRILQRKMLLKRPFGPPSAYLKSLLLVFFLAFGVNFVTFYTTPAPLHEQDFSLTKISLQLYGMA